MFNSGVYIRIDSKNLLLEDMTEEQLTEFFDMQLARGYNGEDLARWVIALIGVIDRYKEAEDE